MKDNTDRVFEIVCQQLGVTRDKLSNETNIFADLGADSLDQVELILELEEEFDINIPDEQAEKVQTIGQLVGLVGELAAA